jgi:hypothetical protein
MRWLLRRRQREVCPPGTVLPCCLRYRSTRWSRPWAHCCDKVPLVRSCREDKPPSDARADRWVARFDSGCGREAPTISTTVQVNPC